MDKCKFNVYALNWNESRVIPAFLHHYRQAQRIIVYDNGSTDNSIQLIQDAGREVRHFDTGGTFDDTTNMTMKNTIWKEAKTEDVDYVIVQDLDEFLYFPDYPDDIASGLTRCKADGYTGGLVHGFNMICSDKDWDFGLQQIQDYSIGVCWTIRKGYHDPIYSKPIVFDPKAFEETNYSVGSHAWAPKGNLVHPKITIRLLHYKYIGVQYSLRNHIAKRDRMSQRNIQGKLGHQYFKSDQELQEYVEKLHGTPTMEAASRPRIKMVIGLHDNMEFLEEARKDKSLQVYAFEPNQTTVERVKRQHRLPDNYHIIQKAVSNTNQRATFNICSNPTCSSLQDWGNGPRFGQMTKVEVDCVRMDEFVTENRIEAIEHLQIDTQGHDLFVLQGFGDKIEIVKEGVCESMAPHSAWKLYQGQPSYQDMKDFFDGRGFATKWEYNTTGGCPKDEVNIHFYRHHKLVVAFLTQPSQTTS